jgi:hypothetical protein
MNTHSLALLATLWAVSPGLSQTGAEPTVKPYRLEIDAGRVSLQVTDGSVVGLVEDLGKRLGFEVLAQGVDDARVTLDFRDLSPGEAIRAICKGVGYIEVPDPETERTIRLVLTPGGKGAKNRLEARREPLAPRPEPPPDPTPPPESDDKDPPTPGR